MSQLTIDNLKKSVEEVIQSAEELEQRYHLEYKKLHSKRFWGWLGAFCIFLTVALVGPALEKPSTELLWGLAFAPFFVMGLLHWRMNASLQSKYLSTIVPELLKSMDESLTIQPNQGFEESELKKCGLFGQSEIYLEANSWNLISGSVFGIDCRWAEVKVKNIDSRTGGIRQSSHENLTGQFLFGTVYHLELPKSLGCSFKLVPDLKEIASIIYEEWFKNFSFNIISYDPGIEPEVLVLRDAPEFESMFTIVTEDKIDVERLLNPTLRSLLMGLAEEFGLSSTVLSIQGKDVYALRVGNMSFFSSPSPSKLELANRTKYAYQSLVMFALLRQYLSND